MVHGVIVFLHVAGMALSIIEEISAKHLSISFEHVTWLILSLKRAGHFEYVHQTENLCIHVYHTYLEFMLLLDD